MRALLDDGGDPAGAVAGIRTALAAQDRSGDPVTVPLVEAFAASMHP